ESNENMTRVVGRLVQRVLGWDARAISCANFSSPSDREMLIPDATFHVKHHLQRCANRNCASLEKPSPLAEFFRHSVSQRSKSNTRNTIFFSRCYVSRETSPKGAQLRCAPLGERASGIF